MNSIAWLRYYQNNPPNWTDPEWHVPSSLDPKTKRALALSLSHFQLGESGGGNFLFAKARKQAPDDAAYHEALELFVAEEQAHARLLEQLVHYFGGGNNQATLDACALPACAPCFGSELRAPSARDRGAGRDSLLSCATHAFTRSRAQTSLRSHPARRSAAHRFPRRLAGRFPMAATPPRACGLERTISNPV